jgi:hypothetical protein
MKFDIKAEVSDDLFRPELIIRFYEQSQNRFRGEETERTMQSKMLIFRSKLNFHLVFIQN